MAYGGWKRRLADGPRMRPVDTHEMPMNVVEIECLPVARLFWGMLSTINGTRCRSSDRFSLASVQVVGRSHSFGRWIR